MGEKQGACFEIINFVPDHKLLISGDGPTEPGAELKVCSCALCMGIRTYFA